jgi:hypothetical protein
MALYSCQKRFRFSEPFFQFLPDIFNACPGGRNCCFFRPQGKEDHEDGNQDAEHADQYLQP